MTAVYRQQVSVDLYVHVEGTEDEFALNVSELRQRIEAHVVGMLAPELRSVADVYARRGPGGSGYFPDGVADEGIAVAFTALPAAPIPLDEGKCQICGFELDATQPFDGHRECREQE